MSWMVGKQDADYVTAPAYFDACRAWHSRLSPDQRETVLTVVDVYTHRGELAAELIAADLPPAPRCPL